MRRLEMERLKREAEERRRERKLLQDIDRSKRFVREYEEEENRREKEKKEKEEMKKMVAERAIPDILHGGRKVYPA